MQISQLTAIVLAMVSSAFADGICEKGILNGDLKPGLFPHGACNFTPAGPQKFLVRCADNSPCDTTGKPCNLDPESQFTAHPQALCQNR
ncbi:hypothetical protein TI39_contig5886g00004 [Zymoseptoria brevis]|uniref:Uncharacterized protein n=1 Tax=Zymoseptoria brevis TaxID=1047168 RepID=A0A0F4G7L1_9PEZI|nr:hypothetical protein TI39_contig5886g00004 [Zymoseptoria brevis]